MNISTQGLQQAIDTWFGGSDGRYRHMLNPSLIYSDGMKDVAEKAGAFWLIDIVATELEPICRQRFKDDGESFHLLLVKVKNGKANLYLAADAHDTYDGVEPLGLLWTRYIDYTDLPDGDWTFYLSADRMVVPGRTVFVLYLPSEY